MGKDKYTRDNIKSDIMQRVIVRVDYEGVSKLEDLVVSLKPKWSGYFKSFNKITKNNFNINVTDTALQSKTISIPDPEKQIIYRFSNCRIGKPETYMDIAESFAYIDIVAGSDYCGTQKFTEIISSYICSLLNHDQFVSLKRVAIRKIDIIKKDKDFNPDDIYEMGIWNNYQNGEHISIKKRYSDVMYLRDVSSYVNIIRDVSYLQSETNTVQKQIVLDMDIYKVDQAIDIQRSSSQDDIQEVFNKKLNDPLFGLFVETFRESYIDKFHQNGAE